MYADLARLVTSLEAPLTLAGFVLVDGFLITRLACRGGPVAHLLFQLASFASFTAMLSVAAVSPFTPTAVIGFTFTYVAVRAVLVFPGPLRRRHLRRRPARHRRGCLRHADQRLAGGVRRDRDRARLGMAYFGIPPLVSVAFAVLLVAVSTTGGRSWRWERLAMALVAFNLLFVVVAVLSHPSPGVIAEAVVTWTPFPHGTAQAFMPILASNIGAK